MVLIKNRGYPMNLSIAYIFSQILVIAYYLIYSITFHLKNKSKILIFGAMATIISSISYFLLNAYTGVAMCFIAILRNALFHKCKSKSVLIIIYIITLIASFFSYQNIFSLLSILATLIYTYSLWQESSKKYKLLGILVNTLMLLYNFSIMSIMGIVFMIIALINSVMGYIIECK